MKRLQIFCDLYGHLPPISVTSEVGYDPQMLLFGGAREKTSGIRLFFVLPFCFFIPLFRPFPVCRLDGNPQSRTEDENATPSRLRQLWQRLLDHLP